MAERNAEPRWPPHAGGLFIAHNQHRSIYEGVEEALRVGTYDRADFPDDAEVARAIAEDSVWEILWYPRNPVSHRTVCAATFARALELANAEGEGGGDG